MCNRAGLGQYNQGLKSVQQGDYTRAALHGVTSLGDIALTYTGLKYVGIGAAAAAGVVVSGAERSVVTGTAVAIIPHGNSLLSGVPQTMYNLVSVGGGAGGDPVNASDPGGVRGFHPPYLELCAGCARCTVTTVSPYFRTSTGANPGGAGWGVESSQTTSAPGAIQPPDWADFRASRPNPLA